MHRKKRWRSGGVGNMLACLLLISVDDGFLTTPEGFRLGAASTDHLTTPLAVRAPRISTRRWQGRAGYVAEHRQAKKSRAPLFSVSSFQKVGMLRTQEL